MIGRKTFLQNPIPKVQIFIAGCSQEAPAFGGCGAALAPERIHGRQKCRSLPPEVVGLAEGWNRVSNINVLVPIIIWTK